MRLKIKKNKTNNQVTNDGYLISDWFCQPLRLTAQLNKVRGGA